jgi:hypothetical protein
MLSSHSLITVKVLTHADRLFLIVVEQSEPRPRLNGPRPPKRVGSDEQPRFGDSSISQGRSTSPGLVSGGKSSVRNQAGSTAYISSFISSISTHCYLALSTYPSYLEKPLILVPILTPNPTPPPQNPLPRKASQTPTPFPPPNISKSPTSTPKRLDTLNVNTRRWTSCREDDGS